MSHFLKIDQKILLLNLKQKILLKLKQKILLLVLVLILNMKILLDLKQKIHLKDLLKKLENYHLIQQINGLKQRINQMFIMFLRNRVVKCQIFLSLMKVNNFRVTNSVLLFLIILSELPYS